jgi:ATP-binding cassette subfamily F protein uup
VTFRGREVHVAGWAKRFMFSAEQLDTPVGRLSGGEQARALIARLMLEPADVLLLDEPTNDLDIPTLEVLEESLLEFPGALVLVTHDRYLLDRVSTQILALDGAGGATTYMDYAQWEIGRGRAQEKAAGAGEVGKAKRGPRRTATADARGLNYRERREWEQMEERILEAERRRQACEQAAADPAVASDHQELSARLGALAAVQAEVDSLYARWAELEAKVTP